ncbi:MAG: TonB-dependent receptor, partial [Bacteroidales bacterium]
MQKKLFPALICLMLCSLLGFAQQKSGANNLAQIGGTVLEASVSGKPVGFATVQLLPQGVYATTQENGSFAIKNIESGKTNIRIDFIGMESIDTTVNILAGKEYTFVFRMKESNFRLEEITVLATQNKAGQSTASNISRQAMDHLQTSSIKDIMQLLPGVEIKNSDMSSANTISIRTIGVQGKASENMNSLGTSIILDGSPLSNNANMQALSPASSGAAGNAGTGVDLRGISTDNIESVTVIRGIPSAEYGDLTSGAVIIKSKAGKEPLSVQFKTNPHIYQVSIGKGIDLGKDKGVLNINGDYAYNTTNQIQAYAYYQRLNVKAMWTKTFFENLNSTTSLSLNFGKDTREKNPDDARTQLASGAKDLGFRFNTNGTINTAETGWLKNIQYGLQFNYTDKHSYYESLLGNAFAPYSMSMTDGTIMSNKPNQKVYDINGKEITNIPANEQQMYATYLPNEYFSHYDMYGKEINLFAKVAANFNKRWNDGKINNRILVGLDYKLDGNMGKGVVYDVNNPPRQSNNNSSSRPRAFSDIPFINQLGVYLQDNYNHMFGDRELNISAGVRFDYINTKTALSPRINASFDIFPRILTIRGGYGINAKAPTALYLYPQNAYFDYINFNNLGSEGISKNEQLLLSTTRVFDTQNNDLKIAKSEKYEVGLDYKFNKNRMRISLTAYKDEVKNGYNMGRDFDCFQLVPYDIYKIAQSNSGTVPTLTLDKRYNVFAMYYKPMNTTSTTNKGLEYEVDLGRISAIRTSFYINGAWMQTKYTNNNYSYSTNGNRNEYERNIGIYEKGVEVNCRERLNTTIRITHNIPKIGFAITLTTQINWKTKIWNEYGNDTMFEKYISRKDGKVYDFDPNKKDDPEF